ncbi:Periplasmic heavy metal sensor [Candidatus Magnetomoraceae bacterium gMMP-15]
MHQDLLKGKAWDAGSMGMGSDMSGGMEKYLPSGKWWRMPEIAEQLKLTDAEQIKLDDLFIKSRKSMIDLKADMAKKHLDLQAVVDAKNFNESATMNQFNNLQTVRTKLSSERFKFMIEVRKLLGNDRFQQLKTKCQKYLKGRMKGPHGRKGPGRMMRQKGTQEMMPPHKDM